MELHAGCCGPACIVRNGEAGMVSLFPDLLPDLRAGRCAAPEQKHTLAG